MEVTSNRSTVEQAKAPKNAEDIITNTTVGQEKRHVRPPKEERSIRGGLEKGSSSRWGEHDGVTILVYMDGFSGVAGVPMICDIVIYNLMSYFVTIAKISKNRNQVCEGQQMRLHMD